MKTSFLQDDIVSCLPELYLVSCTSILLLYGVICASSKYLEFPIILSNLNWLAVQLLIFTLFVIYYCPFKTARIFNNLLIINGFSLFIKSFILLTTIVSLIVTVIYNKYEKINTFEYVILILLSTIGSLFLACSYDLISLYLALELHSFCLYILASLKRTSEFSTEAGLKYFILGAFSSGLLLFGCSFIYGYAGTTNFEELAQILLIFNNYNAGIVIGVAFIFIGFLFKLSAAPFHFWSPDVYEGSPTSITTYFAIVPKIAILSILARLSYDVFFSLFFECQQLFVVLSILSMVIGTLASLWQNKVKRLLAYSSIGHMGYILIGLTASSLDSIYAVFVYLSIYVIMTIAIFTTLLMLRKQKTLKQMKYLKDFSNLAQSNKCVAIFISVNLFSMCGIPPLSGFFSKKLLFVMAVKMNMLFLVLVGVIISSIACFYYIRIIKIMFFDSNKQWCSFIKIEKSNAIISVFSVIVLTLLFLNPAPLFNFVQNSCLFVLS